MPNGFRESELKELERAFDFREHFILLSDAALYCAFGDAGGAVSDPVVVADVWAFVWLQ